jgi:hypothetical protein
MELDELNIAAEDMFVGSREIMHMQVDHEEEVQTVEEEEHVKHGDKVEQERDQSEQTSTPTPTPQSPSVHGVHDVHNVHDVHDVHHIRDEVRVEQQGWRQDCDDDDDDSTLRSVFISFGIS